MDRESAEYRFIEQTVHHLYYDYDTNCAGTSIRCLATLFGYEVCQQAFDASLGMHGAGGYRAQCGLVEGPLMFMGMYFASLGFERAQIIQACRGFGEAFERAFGSLRCCELRPQGFHPGQPPHMCEDLTCRAIAFSFDYIRQIAAKEKT